MAITVSYSELKGSPQVNYTEGRFAATRQLLCDYSDALRLMIELSGSVALNVSNQPIYLNPEQFPDIPAAVVQSCSMQPYQDDAARANGTDTTVATYQKAVVTVNYATPTYEPGEPGTPSDPESFITETYSTSTSFLSLSPLDLFWDSGNTRRLDFQMPLAIPIAQGEYVYERRRFPDPLPDDLTALAGKCNVSTVTAVRIGRVFPAETLLYMGPELRRETVLLADGSQSIKAWDIKQRYKYRSIPWNHFFEPGNDTPGPIYKAGGTQYRPIPTADFSTIRG
jgi:hypothetical protein